MIKEIRNIRSGKRELRQFGIMIGVVMLVLAGYFFWNGKESVYLFLGIAALFIVVGVVVPFVLKPVYIAWMSFASVLSWFMTRVILCMLFYTVFTATRCVSLLFGKRFLEKGWDESKGSYWNHRTKKQPQTENYERQF